MQFELRNDKAAKIAEDAGMKVVMNRCPKIEYARLYGELGWNAVSYTHLTLPTNREV